MFYEQHLRVQISKAKKRQLSCQSFLHCRDLCAKKAAHRTLMKLTQGHRMAGNGVLLQTGSNSSVNKSNSREQINYYQPHSTIHGREDSVVSDYKNKYCTVATVYSRGCQTAALQRIFAAPQCWIVNVQPSLLMIYLVEIP